jgi:NADH dehydrogenase
MILVAGGTGTVGSKVVQALLANNVPVRVMARGLIDWKTSHGPEFRRIGVDVITGDLRDRARVAKAAEGCTAIINVAGVMRDSPDYPLADVNVQSAENLVSVAQEQGIQRLIHVSCLGATQYNDSKYLASKWQSEVIVKKFGFFWTIFRPSLIFADTCHLMNVLDYWVSRMPVVLVVGSGVNHIQPVSADDVAACVAQAVYNRDTVWKVYDLVGPRSYTLTELLEMAVARYGKEKLHFKIPARFGFALARLMERMNPGAPVSEDLMKLMTSDLSGDQAIMQQSFQVPMLSLESSLKEITDWRSSKRKA